MQSYISNNFPTKVILKICCKGVIRIIGSPRLIYVGLFILLFELTFDPNDNFIAVGPLEPLSLYTRPICHMI